MCQNYTLLFPSEYIGLSKSSTAAVHVLIEDKPTYWVILFLRAIRGSRNGTAEVWSLLGHDTSHASHASRPGSLPLILLQYKYT